MAAKNGQSSNQREWEILPEPGYDECDPQEVSRELLQIQGMTERLGFAVVVAPIRVKRDDGSFYNGGFQFRAFTVPAISEEEYNRLRGFVPFDPDFTEDEEDDEPLIATDGASGTETSG